ncbi:hypothetical protein ACFY7Z_26020 [Streptomyces sp. NPDC012623]
MNPSRADATRVFPGARTWLHAATAVMLLMTPGLAFFRGGTARPNAF